MNSFRFLRADGTLDDPRDGGSPWLPSLRQMRDALQLRVDSAVGPQINEEEPILIGTHTTMRQGMGMVIVAALLAGALPFLANWLRAASAGTSIQMLMLSDFATARSGWWSLLGLDGAFVTDTLQQVAGMSSRLPGFMAGFFSALGLWINTVLDWLGLWIANGAAVLAVAHVFGAQTTLQRFFSTTAYAFLPLVLLTLTPIPCVGPLAGLLALIWAALIYFNAVRSVTGLEMHKVVISALLPGVILILAVLLALAMPIGALVRSF